MKREIEHRTQRRSSAEKKLADALLAKAVQRKADPDKFSRAARLTRAAVKSPRHEYNRFFSCVDQLPIHYFHAVGESLTGILGEPDQEMWRGSTYPLLLDDGRVVRLPGNRMLHKLIDAADCIGQRVTITYKGKLYYRYGGHYQKVFSLEPAPLDAAMTKKGRELLDKIQGDAGVKVPPRRNDEPAPLFAKKGGGSATESPEVGRTQKYLRDLHEQEAAFRREKAAKGNRRSLGMRERA